MKVKDFLMSCITTGTAIEVSDVLFYGQVFFRGSVREYIDSDEGIIENLIFVSSAVKGNVLYIEAERGDDYEEICNNRIWCEWEEI